MKQQVAWEQLTTDGLRAYDGGTMSTAGNLVFQGRANGELWVYAADTGKPLKTIATHSHIMAAPMTYSIGGEQYVAVRSATAAPASPRGRSRRRAPHCITRTPTASSRSGSAAARCRRRRRASSRRSRSRRRSLRAPRRWPAGEVLFIQECSRCHALGPNVTPDLRKLPAGLHALFKDILLQGAVAPTGMESFADILNGQDVDNVHAYLIDQAWQAYRAQQAAGH